MQGYGGFGNGAEHGPQLLAAIAEDSPQVPADDKAVNDPATWHGIPDEILGQGHAVSLLEAMLVNPQAVRTMALLVDEAPRRVPRRDFALPSDRNAMQPQPVIDLDTLGHRNRTFRKDLELQPRRSQQLEVACVGEEGKYLP